jgi:hypothetical protein
MNPENRERMNQLCRQIQDEQDPDEFSALVAELEALLAENDRRLIEQQKPS